MPNLKQDRDEIERSLRAAAEHYVQQLKAEVQRRLDELDEAARLLQSLRSPLVAELASADFIGGIEMSLHVYEGASVSLGVAGHGGEVGRVPASMGNGRYRALVILTRIPENDRG